MGHDEFGRRPNGAQKRTQTVDQPRQRDDEKAQSKHCGQLPRTAAIQLRPFCFYWDIAIVGVSHILGTGLTMSSARP